METTPNKQRVFLTVHMLCTVQKEHVKARINVDIENHPQTVELKRFQRNFEVKLSYTKPPHFF